MPSLLNSFRLAEHSAMRTRKLTPVIGAPLVICALVAIPTFLLTRCGCAAAGTALALSSHAQRSFGALPAALTAPGRPLDFAHAHAPTEA